MEDCVFCKIVGGEIPSKKEYEDDEVVVFHDINPVAPIHLLLIPKRHIAGLTDAQSSDLEIVGKIQLIAATVAKKMGIEKGFRLLTANGEEAGQVVFHLHYHLIGGWGRKAGMDKRIWSLGK